MGPGMPSILFKIFRRLPSEPCADDILNRAFTYRVPSRSRCGDARSLIADPTVDVVVVVTPPIYSSEICGLAAQARKPLLIEKPLATTAPDAHTMVVQACEPEFP